MVYQPRNNDDTEYRLFRVLKGFARYADTYAPARVVARYGRLCAARNRAIFETAIRNDIIKTRAAFKASGNPKLCRALPVSELAECATEMLKQLEIKYQQALSALDVAHLAAAS